MQLVSDLGPSNSRQRVHCRKTTGCQWRALQVQRARAGKAAEGVRKRTHDRVHARPPPPLPGATRPRSRMGPRPRCRMGPWSSGAVRKSPHHFCGSPQAGAIREQPLCRVAELTIAKSCPALGGRLGPSREKAPLAPARSWETEGLPPAAELPAWSEQQSANDFS